MKKILASLGVALSLLVGCGTTPLNPTQIATIGVVITQVANQGAVYAIQQDKNNATYFKLAVPLLDNFATGADLSPTALQNALAKATGTNQWVNLAITAVVVAYDVSYSQYIYGQLTNAPAAKIWILDVKVGFEQALAQTGTSMFKSAVVAQPVPYFVKGNAVDKAAIKAKVKTAAGDKK